MRDTLIHWLLILRSFLIGHQQDYAAGFQKATSRYEVSRAGCLDARIRESSGLAHTLHGTWLTHGDSGDGPYLYETDSTGRWLRRVLIADVHHRDWEDLASDRTGRYFIADVGNNTQRRQDLVIYVLDTAFRLRETLSVQYPDQTTFPAPSGMERFDCEAVVFDRDTLWLFSKNYCKDKRPRLYARPLNGAQTLLIDTLPALHRQPVTGAALSPDRQTLALLTYGKVYLFRLNLNTGFCPVPWRVIRHNRWGQAEAIAFDDKGLLWVTCERGKIWKIQPKTKF